MHLFLLLWCLSKPFAYFFVRHRYLKYPKDELEKDLNVMCIVYIYMYTYQGTV